MKYALILITLALACLLALAAHAAPPAPAKPAAKLIFPNSGFTIAPLDEPAAGTAQLLTMYLPPSHGFAPNVGVQIQDYAGSIDDYAALSLKQFASLKFTVLSNTKSGQDTIILNYTGRIQGSLLHSYAKAVSKNGKILLTTAIATEDQWKTSADKLKACVDSFETAQPLKPAGTPQLQPHPRNPGTHPSGKAPRMTHP